MPEKYRLRFTKEEPVRFLGHLDMMRLLQRSARRARLPLAYSEGFNPHPLLFLSAPLPLGMTSGGEYADMELSETIPAGEILERLLAVLPEGVRLLAVTRLRPRVASVMADVSSARYTLLFPNETVPELVAARLPAFLAQETILAEKKTKRNLAMTDIRPDIWEIRPVPGGLEMLLAAGPERSLKASLALAALCVFAETSVDWNACRCCRENLYRRQDGILLPLDEGNVAEEF